MKLPIKDKKFIFLLFAITTKVALEVLSIIGIYIHHDPIVLLGINNKGGAHDHK